MAQCVLLFQNKGHRIVFNRYGQEIIFEYADVDSLGAQCWKILRTIYPVIDGPGGKRNNVMYEFLLKLFEGDAPIPETLGQEFKEQRGRRLET
jgi:hypothetical protein